MILRVMYLLLKMKEKEYKMSNIMYIEMLEILIQLRQKYLEIKCKERKDLYAYFIKDIRNKVDEMRIHIDDKQHLFCLSEANKGVRSWEQIMNNLAQ